MNRALVTGSEGFVGRHIVKRLMADGWHVEGIDLNGGFRVDCREFFRSRDSMMRYDLVVHAAAVVGGRAKIDGDPLAVATNLGVDADMFAWAARTRPGRVVYFSSSAAYPTQFQDGAPPFRLSESDLSADSLIVGPDATYGLTKAVGEALAAVAREQGVPVTVIRPFSGYGTDQSADYPFPSFIDRALKREDPFVVWGDGQQVRDWIHIDDIVELTMRCVAQGVDGPVNACTGEGRTFQHLAETVTFLTDYSPTIQYLTDKPTGVAYRVGDPTLMQTIYEPQVRFMDGIRRALEGK